MERPREEADRLRLIGRLSGLSFLGMPLMSIPLFVGFGMDDPGRLIPLWAASAAVGLLMLLVPADRAPSFWIPGLAVAATGMCTWGSIVSAEYATAALWPYLLVAAIIGQAIRDLRAVAALTGLLCAGMVLALVLGDQSSETRVATIAAIPVLVTITTVIATLQRRQREAASLLRIQASTDALTQVGNRRLLDERLAYEVRRHQRTGRQLGLFIVDLDDFKDVNDRVGHLAGDALLRQAAAALGQAVRASDTVARYGGDEFAVLAPELDGGAERLASAIAGALASVEACGRPLTASLGWAQFPEDALDAAGLLQAADDRERRAKIAARPAGEIAPAT